MADKKPPASSSRGGSIADAFLQAEARLQKDGDWQVQKGRQNKLNRQKTEFNTYPSDALRQSKRNDSFENPGYKTRNQFQSGKNESRSSEKRFKKNDHVKERCNEPKKNISEPQNEHMSETSPSSAHQTKTCGVTNRSKSREYNTSPGKISYTKLQQMSLKDSTDILRILANSHSGLDDFLKSKIKPDMMYLIIKVLRKLTESDWEENKEHVLIRVTTPEFFQKITEFVTFLATDEQSFKRKDEMEQFFDNLLTFFHAIMIMLPSVAADHMTKPLRMTKMAMGSVEEFQNVTLSNNINDRLKLLLADFEERKKEKEEREKIEKESKEAVYPKPLGSISEVPIYPRPEDVENRHGAMVPKNKIEGPYSSVEHYLDVQFRLLREDFIAPVRQGIQEYRIGHNDSKSTKNKKTSNLKIYSRVKFLKPKVISDKVGYDICFDPEKRMKVKWEHSKRFIFGSLLLFTTDNFHTFFLGTVINRDLPALEKDRIVTVLLCDTNNLNLSKQILTTEFLMAESEVYFEPYFNVLRALQRFNSDSFPMKKYIVYTQTKTDRPAHTKNGSDIYTISVGDNALGGRKTLKLFDDSTWPSCHELGFDVSQLNAYRAALTNDLVVIQGPPGTGKTYLGLKIAGALLENKAMWSNNQHTPILVICYTNHALDQFLEGIIQKDLSNNIIRIGGRSKSELLDPFNLRERRRSVAIYSSSYEQAALMRDLKKEMTNIFESIKILQDNLEHLNNNDGILALRTLTIVMNESQKSFFRNNDDLIEWLLSGVKHQVRSQNSLFSTDDKQTKRLNNVVEFVFDPSDFENVARLKEVLFDGFELEEVNEQQTESEKDMRVYFTCTLEEIKKKIEDQTKLLEAIPGSEESREIIKQKMREAKKAESDLNLMYVYFNEKLKNATGPSQGDTSFLYEIQDLNTLDTDKRWLLYKSWIEFLKSGYWMLLCKQEELFRKGGRRYDEVRQFDDLRIVQQADVVGVTTTTAARLQTMLRELKPKIVIVEEAAEVLEAHIVASLSVHCQQLILIGDHKQLRPSAADYKIGKDYHLEVSLFERLINNKINFHTLTTQHRMRPEISKLLVPTIYPILENHVTTLNRERIRGMDKNVFFMTHNNLEQEVDDIMSKRNKFEARMVMLLARHLLLQGYRPDEITVLTTYSGQMYLLKDEQNRLEISKDLQVTVVDNFQGEENRIILLSLVRSNADNRIGFLKTENRVCVALSRARDGLYVFGNMDCLIAGSTNTLWQRIKQSFVDLEGFGPALTLRCETHGDQLTRVVTHSDFNSVMEGGCSKPCGEKLGCGHICRSLCHVSKDRHIRYRCSQPCNRLMCADRHPCPRKCYQDCGQCTIPMNRTLKCGHQVMLPCCVAYNEIQCKQLVKVRFPECQHEVQVECFRKNYKACPEPCPFRLDCGHACTRTCHVNDDPDHLKYICAKSCARRPPGCTTAEHRCPLACFEECEPCQVDVVKHLPCGHTLTTMCSNKALLCEAVCRRAMACGHLCQLLCYEECTNCPIKVEKTVTLCGHKVVVACSQAPEKKRCKGQCSVPLRCGHKCTKRCCDPCTSEDCQELTRLPLALPCGHTGALMPCNMVHSNDMGSSYDKEQMLQYCSEPCLAELSCGHRCSGTCGQCMQGRIHKVCDEDCNNTLICGHSCPVPCRKVCPPCEKKCQNRCIHSKCSKKCGEPCAPCNEQCEYKCPHRKCRKKCGEMCDRPPCTESCYLKLPCSHPCVGFCGEPCPPCKQCSPEHYQPYYDIFGGPDEGDEETEKWILLSDCKHVVEVTTLEQWLSTDQEGKSEIKHKTCPLCRPTEPNRFIITTQRYMNLVKQTYIDIQMVKSKLFGEINTIRKDRQELLAKIAKISPKEMEGFHNSNKEGDELYSLYKHLQKDLPSVRNQRRKEIDRECFHVLEYKVLFLTNLVDLRNRIQNKLSEEALTKLMNKVNILTRALKNRNKKISTQEVESFESELKRITRFGNFLILESSNEFKTSKANNEVIKCHKEAEELVNKLVEYTDEHDSKVGKAIEDFKKAIKSNAQLTDAERKMIHQAMSKDFYGGSTAQGHWFKCPNGHPYVITECGGAMQRAKCPEEGCGAPIGGSRHQYLPGQQLASEFDGARRPAWSSGNDMANFDLNNIH